ncbi:hypothetical protein TNCV_4464511 [Trichonephila clavipes]|nr:hypothetical protein TNCV_4464511 [Trichonephila clavipes]
MVKIWETEKIPIEWEEGSVCPIFKKVRLQPWNVRKLIGITLPTRHIKYSPTSCCLQDFSLILTKLYKEPQVTQVIRSNRLRWLGHIWRSPENNQTRAYTFKNPMWDLEQ